MFQIPRPKTRADCRDEARPWGRGAICPWVACRHHLLLEVATAAPHKGRDARATTIRLNRASPERTQTGRRAGIPAKAAEGLFRIWLDDALEHLAGAMPYTCALDVVEDFPDGLSSRRVGLFFGVSEQQIDIEQRKPHVVEAIAGLRKHLFEDE